MDVLKAKTNLITIIIMRHSKAILLYMLVRLSIYQHNPFLPRFKSEFIKKRNSLEMEGVLANVHKVM